MEIQPLWDALCRAYESHNWEELEFLLPQLKSRIEAGEAPIVTAAVGESFNLALARAGVEFITAHFRQTAEWPTLSADTVGDEHFGSQ
jgi:hypothetical protein